MPPIVSIDTERLATHAHIGAACHARTLSRRMPSCSESLRADKIESISSMKMRDGCRMRAIANKARTSLSLSPSCSHPSANGIRLAPEWFGSIEACKTRCGSTSVPTWT